MGENGDVIKVLAVQMKRVAKKIIEKAHFDKTHTGVVKSVKSDGYVVAYNGTEIHIKTNFTGIYKRNDIVKFCIPCGNKGNAFLVREISNPVSYGEEALNASMVGYNNLTSGLTANNVNGAIDELLTEINKLKASMVSVSNIDDSAIDNMLKE